LNFTSGSRSYSFLAEQYAGGMRDELDGVQTEVLFIAHSEEYGDPGLRCTSSVTSISLFGLQPETLYVGRYEDEEIGGGILEGRYARMLMEARDVLATLTGDNVSKTPPAAETDQTI